MPGDIVWEPVQEENPEDTAKVWIGKSGNVTTTVSPYFKFQVPIMLQSEFCILHNLSDREMYDLNECPYDAGRYFIIREGAHCSRGDGHESCLRFRKSSTVSHQLPCGDPQRKCGKTIS